MMYFMCHLYTQITFNYPFQAHWIYKRRLGGAMIWSIDLDDYSGKYCGLGHFPLTNAMRKVLDGRKVLDRSVRKNNTTSVITSTLTFIVIVACGFIFS